MVLGPGEVAEFDTRVPHWFGCADDQPVEMLSIFGPQGERMHVRAKPRAFRVGARGVEGVQTRMIGRSDELDRLRDMAAAGLVELDDEAIQVTASGWFLVRAIAMVFDQYLQGSKQARPSILAPAH